MELQSPFKKKILQGYYFCACEWETLLVEWQISWHGEKQLVCQFGSSQKPLEIVWVSILQVYLGKQGLVLSFGSAPGKDRSRKGLC